MKNNNKKIYDWQSLLFELTKKEISVRYKKTFFGFLWMFLNPLSQMLILGFVFQNFVNITLKTNNYFLFLFVGLVVWNFFANTLLTTIPIYVNERALLQKSKFPREIILLSVVFSNFFHFLVSMIVLLFFMIVFMLFKNNMQEITIMIIKTPLILLTTSWLGFFISGIGLLLSSLNVRFRDISFFTSAALPLLFYATPIIWEIHFVPKRILPFLYLNPLTSIVEINRFVFLNENLSYYPGIVLGLITSIIVFIIGFKIFKAESPFFDDWL